jgi:adenylate cyclase
MLRLKTVRAKLTMLVALSIVMVLATLPVLSWLLHQQLIDSADNRVSGAASSFHAEIEDDIADLKLAAHVLATNDRTAHALRAKDKAEALALGGTFMSVYPNIDVLFVDAGEQVLADLGCTGAPEDLRALVRATTSATGKEFHGIVAHGCERGPTGMPPAYAVGVPVAGGGAVLVCLPLDLELITKAGLKLGLELAIVPLGSREPLAMTRNFPVGSIPDALNPSPELRRERDATWAIERFDVDDLRAADQRVIDLVAALDVADIQRLVRRNLMFALGVLLLAAAVSVTAGARLAGVMSTALTRVNVALKKLEQQEYVHVDTLRTGDELEDLATGFNTMVDGLKERDKLRTTFGKYMTASVMEHLLNGKVSLGGEKLEVTVLFTDIRSFTTISEKMDAHALVALLNEYFTEMVHIVMEEDGVVDKYIGDAIMAVFGAPVPKPDDAIHAVRAAVRMRHALRQLNERLRERGIQPLRTGIGLHTGEVVAGNIGSEARMEYTVIGDAVNLASRLESNTKELGVNILISEDTYERVKDKVVARKVREITVKGRAQPVMTYEVLGFEGEKNIDRDSQPASKPVVV